MTILKGTIPSRLHVRGSRSRRARARQPPRFPSARRVFTPRRTRGVGASMLSRLSLRAAARAMHSREARYVAPASAPIDPFARCDHPRPCLRRECTCLAPWTSPRASAYRAGSDALLTRSCAPTLDRPSPFPTAEELLDEEIQAEEEGGLSMEPGPARLRYFSAEPRKRTPILPLVPTFTRQEKIPPRLTQPRHLPDTQGQGRGASPRG